MREINCFCRLRTGSLLILGKLPQGQEDTPNLAIPAPSGRKLVTGNGNQGAPYLSSLEGLVLPKTNGVEPAEAEVDAPCPSLVEGLFPSSNVNDDEPDGPRASSPLPVEVESLFPNVNGAEPAEVDAPCPLLVEDLSPNVNVNGEEPDGPCSCPLPLPVEAGSLCPKANGAELAEEGAPSLAEGLNVNGDELDGPRTLPVEVGSLFPNENGDALVGVDAPSLVQGLNANGDELDAPRAF